VLHLTRDLRKVPRQRNHPEEKGGTPPPQSQVQPPANRHKARLPDLPQNGHHLEIPAQANPGAGGEGDAAIEEAAPPAGGVDTGVGGRGAGAVSDLGVLEAGQGAVEMATIVATSGEMGRPDDTETSRMDAVPFGLAGWKSDQKMKRLATSSRIVALSRK